MSTLTPCARTSASSATSSMSTSWMCKKEATPSATLNSVSRECMCLLLIAMDSVGCGGCGGHKEVPTDLGPNAAMFRGPFKIIRRWFPELNQGHLDRGGGSGGRGGGGDD